MRIFIFAVLALLSGCAPAVVFNSRTASGNTIEISGAWDGFIELRESYFATSSGKSQNSTIDGKRTKIQVRFAPADQQGSIRGSVTEYRETSFGTTKEYVFGDFFVSGTPEKAFWTYSDESRGTKQIYKTEYFGRFDANDFSGLLVSTRKLDILFSGTNKVDPNGKFINKFRVSLRRNN
jgi:hypothetical protein